MFLPESRKRTMLFAIALFTLVGVSLLLGFGYFLIHPAKKAGNDKVFLVRDGATLRQVSGKLEKEGLITSKELFLLWARLMGYSRKIKAGEYSLNSHMSPVNILKILSKGAIITYPVTVPEGFTRKQIAALLEKKGLLDSEEFLSATWDSDIAKRHGISGRGLEGYLYPDTYHFGRGLSAVSIIDAMVKRFQEVIAAFREKIEHSGMTMEEVVILASIVEKETGHPEERPLIASVFLNRLRKRMRLESDPTVIYGLKDFNGNLTRIHLTGHTPYNTYVIQGLPPTPIANPGMEAIKAVLYPAKTDYLYFVSKNDGSHHFSKNLSEHNRAVDIYQKRRPKDRGRTS
jgi:UPF0755 protein